MYIISDAYGCHVRGLIPLQGRSQACCAPVAHLARRAPTSLHITRLACMKLDNASHISI